MKKTVTASALMMTMVLSTALLGACSKTETETTATPADSTSSTTTTTTTTPSAATGTTDSATTGAAATAPAADAASAAADSAASAANSAATAATSAANTAGDAMSDSAVTGKVKAMLLADSEVKGTDINVETNKGEVMLSGFVESQAQIDKATTLASGIEGVQKVNNKLEVKK